MALRRQQKEAVVERVGGALTGAGSVVFLNFSGLKVSEQNEIRAGLRGEGVSYTVAKKSLLRRVLSDLDVSGEVPELAGELSIAWSEDSTAASREAYSFAKKFDGKFTILGGIFDGSYQNQSEMTAIAQIPSLDTLRGMFVNVINSPIQRYAIALGQIAEKRA